MKTLPDRIHVGQAMRTTRRADIQGLRAVAVLMVVVYHAGLPFPGGYVGVDVFFVISGFVITALLQREWAASGRIRFSRFYARRFKRLTPALALMVAVTLIPAFLLIPPFTTFENTLATALGAMLLTANVVIAVTTGDYFAAPAHVNPLLHTWSLSVEEQFYLVFPALMGLCWYAAARSRRWKAAPVLVLAFVAALSFGAALLGSFGYVLPRGTWLIGFYSPITRVWEFAVGSLLALAAARLTVLGRSRSLASGVAGAALLAASLFLITDATPFPGLWTLLPVVGTAFLLAAGTGSANAVTQALSAGFLVKIGDLSYSIYLWHWPFIVFAKILWPDAAWVPLGAAALSFVVAMGSYTWVEEPIRDMPAPSRGRMAALVLVTVLLPIGLAGLLAALPRSALLPAEVETAVKLVSEQHAPQVRGCFGRGPYTDELVGGCGWNSTAGGAPIYLIGDSDAMHFAEAAIGAGEQLGRPVWVFTAPSCLPIAGARMAWVDQSRFFPGRINHDEFAHCQDYVRFVLDWLQEQPPGDVFVAGLDQYWWDPSIGVAFGGAAMTSDAEQKAAVLAEGLARTASTLQAAGHRVVLVQSIPTYRNPTPIWDPRTCSVPAIQAGACSRQMAAAYVDDLQRRARSSIEQAAQATGAAVLDLRDWFCDTEVCSTDKPVRWQYSDATHLTVAASRALTPRFAAVLESVQPGN